MASSSASSSPPRRPRAFKFWSLHESGAGGVNYGPGAKGATPRGGSAVMCELGACIVRHFSTPRMSECKGGGRASEGESCSCGGGRCGRRRLPGGARWRRVWRALHLHLRADLRVHQRRGSRRVSSPAGCTSRCHRCLHSCHVLLIARPLPRPPSRYFRGGSDEQLRTPAFEAGCACGYA